MIKLSKENTEAKLHYLGFDNGLFFLNKNKCNWISAKLKTFVHECITQKVKRQSVERREKDFQLIYLLRDKVPEYIKNSWVAG